MDAKETAKEIVEVIARRADELGLSGLDKTNERIVFFDEVIAELEAGQVFARAFAGFAALIASAPNPKDEM